eukprot:gene1725-494_t
MALKLRELKFYYPQLVILLMALMLMWIGITAGVGHGWLMIVDIYFFPKPFRYTIVVGFVCGVAYFLTGMMAIAATLIPNNTVQAIMTCVTIIFHMASCLVQYFSYQFETSDYIIESVTYWKYFTGEDFYITFIYGQLFYFAMTFFVLFWKLKSVWDQLPMSKGETQN